MNTTQLATSISQTTCLQRFTIDPMHSMVGFSVRHVMITNVHGAFETFRGTVLYDAQRPEATSVEAEIETASVNTRQAQRDAHLRSADFFDAEQFPTMNFRSTGVRLATDGTLELTGELTLRGVTRPITLQLLEVTSEFRDHNGATRIGASARGKLRRSQFGIVYNKLLEVQNSRAPGISMVTTASAKSRYKVATVVMISPSCGRWC